MRRHQWRENVSQIPCSITGGGCPQGVSALAKCPETRWLKALEESDNREGSQIHRARLPQFYSQSRHQREKVVDSPSALLTVPASRTSSPSLGSQRGKHENTNNTTLSFQLFLKEQLISLFSVCYSMLYVYLKYLVQTHTRHRKTKISYLAGILCILLVDIN